MRNFGIPRVTGSTAVGGNQPSSPHDSATCADTDSLTRASCFLDAPNSRAGDFEIGAGFFFVSVPLLAAAIMLGTFFIYQALIAKPVEYQPRLEAYRLKGH